MKRDRASRYGVIIQCRAHRLGNNAMTVFTSFAKRIAALRAVRRERSNHTLSAHLNDARTVRRACGTNCDTLQSCGLGMMSQRIPWLAQRFEYSNFGAVRNFFQRSDFWGNFDQYLRVYVCIVAGQLQAAQYHLCTSRRALRAATQKAFFFARPGRVDRKSLAQRTMGMFCYCAMISG